MLFMGSEYIYFLERNRAICKYPSGDVPVNLFAVYGLCEQVMISSPFHSSDLRSLNTSLFCCMRRF